MMKGELFKVVSMNDLDLLKVVGEFYSQHLSTFDLLGHDCLWLGKQISKQHN